MIASDNKNSVYSVYEVQNSFILESQLTKVKTGTHVEENMEERLSKKSAFQDDATDGILEKFTETCK